ncbi:MAG: hypothetical protein QW343_02060 [Candidatus Norongarragalinales archaeon]
MNLLLVFVLAVIAFILVNEGMLFLGFIALVLLVLAFFSAVASGKRPTQSSGGTSTGPDVIIEQEEPDVPSNIDIKIKPNWEANSLFEDIFAADGEMLDTLGRAVVRTVTGGKYGKPRKTTNEEPEW